MAMFDDPNEAWETWQRVALMQRRDRAHPSGGSERGIVTRDDACSALNGAAQLIGQALKSGAPMDPHAGSVAVMLLLAARDYVLPLPALPGEQESELVNSLTEIVGSLRAGPFAPW